MSDRFTFAVPTDLRLRLQSVLPGARDADFAALGHLIASDRMVRDDGGPHPDFVAWVARILERDDPAETAWLPAPRPKPMPGMMEVAL